MKITVDNREPVLYDKLVERVSPPSSTIQLQSSPLVLGDIVLSVVDRPNETSAENPIVVFERKSLQDLVSSIKDGRYEEQSHRLIHSSGVPTHNIVYIIEGMYSQLRHESDKKMCLSAITSLSIYKGFSVFRTCSITETAELIFSMASKIHKETIKGGRTPAFSNSVENGESSSNTIQSQIPVPPAYCEVVHKVKKDNITPENIGAIMLCSIPGISSTTAIEIMRPYSTFAHFMAEIRSRPEQLDEIYITSKDSATDGKEKRRKLGKNVIENIRLFLL